MTIDKTPAPKWRKAVLAAGAGAVTGFLVTLGFMRLVNSGTLGAISTSGEIAALIGIVYLVTALAVGVGVASPRFGARFLNVEDADELQEQRRMLAFSGLSMASIGGVLIVLALAQSAGVVPATIAFAIALVLVVLATWFSLQSRRYIDELMASVSRETASTAFYLLALVGGGWSALAHLGFVTAPAAIDWISMFAGLLLAAAFGVCGYRGMLRPR